MAVRANSATHRDIRSALSQRSIALLATWVALVVLAGALAALGGADRSTSDDLAVLTASATDAVVVPAPSTTTTTVPETTTTTAPPTTLPPAPPTTAAPVVVTPRSSTPAPAPAPAPEPEPAPAPPAPAPAPPPAPANVDAAAEQQLLDDHNSRRAAQGLPPLQRHGCLDAIARDWAAQMAGVSNLAHNPGYADAIGACLAWTAIGENVGYSGTIAELADRFWGSSAHRSNIVGGFKYVGIGVVVGADGLRWASLEFANV